MHEVALRRSIKRLISDNTPKLLTGIVKNGMQINQIQLTTSGHTPIAYFPFIAILVLRVAEREQSERRNVRRGKKDYEYDLVISLVNDIDQLEEDTDEPYETDDSYHQLLGDRIIDLLNGQTFVIDNETDLKFELNPSAEVVKENSGDRWSLDDGGYLIVDTSTIRISILQRCTNDQTLY